MIMGLYSFVVMPCKDNTSSFYEARKQLKEIKLYNLEFLEEDEKKLFNKVRKNVALTLCFQKYSGNFDIKNAEHFKEYKDLIEMPYSDE